MSLEESYLYREIHEQPTVLQKLIEREHKVVRKLAAAIQARHEYGPEVEAAVERFHAAMGALQLETVQHVLAMRKVLTPEQAAKFDRRVSEALTNETP